MAMFTQYALSAADQALQDSGYIPTTDEQKDMTGVCCGSGIGSFEDVVDTTIVHHEGVYYP
jgi:3-oxoacyl-[acyl-carrier-protein] synthase II